MTTPSSYFRDPTGRPVSTGCAPRERAIQRAILAYLAWEPRVAWSHRFNTGAAASEHIDQHGRKHRQFVRFAFPGCSDILGQLRTGEFLAIEVKRPGEKPSPEQAAFLRQVADAGGLAICAHRIDDITNALDQFQVRATQHQPGITAGPNRPEHRAAIPEENT